MRRGLMVDGEELGALVEILLYLNLDKQSDGTVRVSSEAIPNAIATPFVRALMRREARLLREEADALGPQSVIKHSEQRRGDAFVDLILSVCAAAAYASRGASQAIITRQAEE